MSAQPMNPNVPPDHVTIDIDGRSMVVPKGSMIIAAADKAGIALPRFCYHDKLTIAANCRMCMVEVEMGGKPMPKPQPACATPVADGMKVLTQSQKALSAQRNVMEFLLINHPLDCPICDQGGECQLQDLAVGYGASSSRYQEKKRVVFHKYMGPLISAEEMTRCIHCTRCVRFGLEIAGVMELGMSGRGEHAEIETFVGRTVDSANWRVAKSVFVARDAATAKAYATSPDSPYVYYYHQLFTKLKRSGRLELFKTRRDQPDAEVTLEEICDKLIIYGTPESVADQLLAFQEEIGAFGTLLYAGKDWRDRELGRQSMILMAEKVLPRINAAPGLSA